MNQFAQIFSLKRLHLFEIEDQKWCPKMIRDGVTDFLQHIVQVFALYRPISSRLANALNSSRQKNIIDLCSGGSGPWKFLLKELENHNLKVTLTDLFPNHSAFQKTKSLYPQNVNFLKSPIDASKVPTELLGFRTLFSSFHHLTPKQAQEILQNAVDAKVGIAVFESTQRHPLSLLYMLFTPLLVLMYVPRIRPFRWSRLFWTYIIPLIPFIVMFDGIVSCLRTYNKDELKALTENLTGSPYHWEIGLEPIGKLPIGVTYLIGFPKTSEPVSKNN